METTSRYTVDDQLLNSWLWHPNIIVFFSNACIMILEIVAGRIIAPYVGVSLYTWTSVIGVVLAGISLGNYIGGRLADRRASLRLLGSVFIVAGIASLGILTIEDVGPMIPSEWSIVIEILVLTTVLFFIPSTILGMISPIVAKLAVRNLDETGSVVGNIYASGAAGSIAGTFLSGFVLISTFGTHAIVWYVAIALLILGVVFVTGGRLLVAGGLAVLLYAGSFVAQDRGWLNSSCIRETNYFCIKVKQEERDGEQVRILILDRLVHSYTSLEDPTKLVYGYEKIYAEATAYQAQRVDNLRALFIGGGGYTFPKYMDAVYPESRLHVIEIDPGVTEMAHALLGLERDTDIVTYNEDARLFLEENHDRTYNLVYGDAFNDYSVPYHLTTKQFNERVHDILADDGLYMVNIIDGARGDFLRAYTYTMRQTFEHVYLIPTTTSWRTSVRTTFVLIATDAPMELDAFNQIDAGDGQVLLANRIVSEETIDELLASKNTVLLTDRYAPVDQMLAPVFRDETVE